MIGQKIIELNRVDSTNAYANLVVAEHDFDDGVVIWAHEQFAGRGQHDHQWSSEAGKNLTCTVCLKPHFLAPDRQFQLNKAISLGVLDFVRHFLNHSSLGTRDSSCSVKWPNDIYVGDKKIGGILIEHKIMGSVLGTSIAGIGVNINQTRFAPDIPNPVSLIHVLRHETLLKDALQYLCAYLNTRYARLQQPDLNNLDLEFNQNLLGYNQWRNFSSNGILLEGRITGVDDIGRLQIETRNGAITSYNHKEIEYVI
jgi:BirA family biotin operon repressor/biotin-[acetyl-CoA-carboxylase] ligase